MGSWTLAGATVMDGTGSPGYTADVVIEADRIAGIGSGERRGTVIDAEGLVAVPGFVDIHSHVDWIAPLAAGPDAARGERAPGHHDVGGGQLRDLAGAARQQVQPRRDRADAPRGLGDRGARLELELRARVPRRARAARSALQRRDLRRAQHAPGHRPRRASARADADRAGRDGSAARRRPRRRGGRALGRARVLPRPLRRPVRGRGARADRGRARRARCGSHPRHLGALRPGARRGDRVRAGRAAAGCSSHT